jgi:hypothetical protein
MRGDRQCLSCSNALCSACARSQQHHHCGECRTRNGQAAHVVDVGWRVGLLIDSSLAAWRAVPQRASAVLALLLVSLLAPFSLLAFDLDEGFSGSADGALVDAALVGLIFATTASALGWFFQPLFAAPQLRSAGLGRRVIAGLVGTATAFLPLALVVAACVGLDAVINDAEIVGNLAGLAFLAVAPVSIAVGLTWQGRILLFSRPGLRGLVGAVVAHCCVVGVWSTLVWVLLIPLGAAALLAAVVSADAAAAGVVGVVAALVVWLFLLLGSGAFAAASARFSNDLDRLT